MVTKAVTVNPLPSVFITSGGGSYCAGGAGVPVWESGSQVGVSYQLYNGITAADTALPGTGISIGFGAQSAPGAYTVIATNTATGCTQAMAGAATVGINPVPAIYAVTGGGSYCAGGAGAAIGLGGSVAGVNYQLYYGTGLSGTAIPGTGGALAFGERTAAGTYTVKATNGSGCSNNMSDSAVVSITPTVRPSAAITAAPGDTLCAGTTAGFTATAVNGGTAPLYQWQVNGAATGSGGPSFSYTPANGDAVNVVLTSSATCALPADTISNTIHMTVDQLLVPVVTITASPGSVITTGQSVTFTATVSNGGTLPAYQWAVNGVAAAGATTATYTSSALTDGDIVTCAVTSGGQCGGQTQSGAVTMTVNGNVGVKVAAAGSAIRVLPNPNKGEFTISGTTGSGTDETVSLVITDMLGQQVYKSNVIARNGQLNERISLGSSVANGMYMLSLRSGTDNEVFHIVIEQ